MRSRKEVSLAAAAAVCTFSLLPSFVTFSARKERFSARKERAEGRRGNCQKCIRAKPVAGKGRIHSPYHYTTDLAEDVKRCLPST